MNCIHLFLCVSIAVGKKDGIVSMLSSTLARYVIDNNLITHVPSQGAFIGQGRDGKYCVTLFSKETCQCPSTTTEFSLCGCAKIVCTVCSCLGFSIISEGATNYLGRTNSSLIT
jgi:hypothetical protein